MILLDYYKILGVPRGATNNLIKNAYHRRAKLFHPDVSKFNDAKIKFQLINEAYRILSDKKMKRIYDFKLKYHNRPHHRDRQQRYTKDFARYYQYYSQPRNNYYYYQREKTAVNKKHVIDRILFYALIGIGLLASIFGIIDLFFQEWYGIESLTGILFGLSFLFLLIYGWRKMWKNK